MEEQIKTEKTEAGGLEMTAEYEKLHIMRNTICAPHQTVLGDQMDKACM
jgi:hypothetical protein